MDRRARIQRAGGEGGGIGGAGEDDGEKASTAGSVGLDVAGSVRLHVAGASSSDPIGLERREAQLRGYFYAGRRSSITLHREHIRAAPRGRLKL